MDPDWMIQDNSEISGIAAVKANLEAMKQKGLILEWELPCEELFSELSQAVFFLSPADDSRLKKIWEELGRFKYLSHKPNTSNSLSRLPWRVVFNQDL